jgi:hypothetical protein
MCCCVSSASVADPPPACAFVPGVFTAVFRGVFSAVLVGVRMSADPSVPGAWIRIKSIDTSFIDASI